MTAASERASAHETLYDDLRSRIDRRTFDLLERRRQTPRIRGRGWLVRRLLLAADAVGVLVAMLLAEGLVAATGDTGSIDVRNETLFLLATLPAWIVVAKLYGLYDRDEERTDHSTADDFSGVFHMVTVCTWLLWATSWTTGVVDPRPEKLLLFWAFGIVLISSARAAARAIAGHTIWYLQNTIIVGAGQVGQLIAKRLRQRREYGLNLIGFVDDDPPTDLSELFPVTMLGDTNSLLPIVRLLDVERVIFAFSGTAEDETLQLVHSLRELDVQVDVVPRFFEVICPRVDVHTVSGIPLIGLPSGRLSRSSLLLKRALDIILGVPAVIFLSPLIGLIAVAIKLDGPGPVLFRQMRIGANGVPFRIFKFRSMAYDAEERKAEVSHLNEHLARGEDARMFKIVGDPRVTRIGRWLRRTSFDELPQLINVVRGEMSLVGPRPLIPAEAQHVASWARRRLELRPGITGAWQVSGRHDIPFGEMTRLDYIYVTSWSLFNDIKILARTIPAVFRRSGL